MNFTEPLFLFLFLPVVLAASFAARPSRHAVAANWVLLVASVAFYAKDGGLFTLLILASIVFNYRIALAVAASTAGRRTLLTLAVAVNLSVLGLFKYAGFLAENVRALYTVFGGASFPLPHVLLPIGISFFTFHAISYVVDVYRGDAVAQKSPAHAALYLLLFPQLIAGPIVRYREIADQLSVRQVDLEGFAAGVRRFVIGLGKKTLVANTVAVPADRIFALPLDQLTTGHA